MKLNWNDIHLRITHAGRSRRPRGVTHDPNWDPLMHGHDLWYIWAGHGVTQTRQGPAELRSGSCLWCKPGYSYPSSWEPNNPLGTYFVIFDLLDGRGNPIPIDDRLPPDILHPADTQVVEAVMRRVSDLLLRSRWREEMVASPQEGPTLDAATGLLRGLLMDLDDSNDDEAPQFKASPRHLEIVNTAATLLMEFPENFARVDELADRAGYSPEHFARIFKELLGRSPKEFAIAGRIKRARQLLSNPDLAVKEVARLLGYQNIYYFSLQFKRETGTSPTQFRKQLLK